MSPLSRAPWIKSSCREKEQASTVSKNTCATGRVFFCGIKICQSSVCCFFFALFSFDQAFFPYLARLRPRQGASDASIFVFPVLSLFHSRFSLEFKGSNDQKCFAFTIHILSYIITEPLQQFRQIFYRVF